MRKTWIAGVAVAIATPALAPTDWRETGAHAAAPAATVAAGPAASGHVGLPPMSPWLLPARATAPRGEPLRLCDCAMDLTGARPAPVRIELPAPVGSDRRDAEPPRWPPASGWHAGGPGSGAAGPTPAPVAPVPEPTAWLMMIAGLGLAGVALRRRRAIA